MTDQTARIGIVGGSGLYQMPGLEDVVQHQIETPFGPPSDDITVGTLDGVRVAFLPRHGKHHQFSPTQIPVRANIWALKSLGIETLVSVSAVGSMREEMEPLHVVVPDQIFDRTVSRPRTFFDNFVVHVALDNPFCGSVQTDLYTAALAAGATCHQGGVYICIEGPQFSTKAESRVYRSWGMDIIGMTAMPEARLAREAGLCYGLLAMVTDFDVWHESEEPVSIQTVLGNLRKNVELSRAVVRNAVRSLTRSRECTCGSAIKDAIATSAAGIPPAERERLALLLPG